jgi:hypothetical protein
MKNLLSLWSANTDLFQDAAAMFSASSLWPLSVGPAVARVLFTREQARATPLNLERNGRSADWQSWFSRDLLVSRRRGSSDSRMKQPAGCVIQVQSPISR